MQAILALLLALTACAPGTRDVQDPASVAGDPLCKEAMGPRDPNVIRLNDDDYWVPGPCYQRAVDQEGKPIRTGATVPADVLDRLDRYRL